MVSELFSYCLRIFSVKTCNFLKFFRILQLTSHSTIVFFFWGFNGVVWAVLEKFQTMLPISKFASLTKIFVCCVYLYFSFISNLFLPLNQSGSLSLHTTVSWGIKLLRMFKTVLLNIATFSLTFVFEKAFSQSNIAKERLINSVVCHTSRKKWDG